MEAVSLTLREKAIETNRSRPIGNAISMYGIRVRNCPHNRALN